MTEHEYLEKKQAIQEQLRNDMIDLEYQIASLVERGASALFDLETEYRGIQVPPVSTHTAPILPMDSAAVDTFLEKHEGARDALAGEYDELRRQVLSGEKGKLGTITEAQAHEP